MTIEFKEEQIAYVEERRREPFIGYFAPNGELINYNVLLGGNYHDAWRNPVSISFLSWVSYIVQGTSIEELKHKTSVSSVFTNNYYPGIDEYVKWGNVDYDFFVYKNLDKFLEALHRHIEELEDNFYKYGGFSGYAEFQYRLSLFFKNAYKNKRFFDSIQRKIIIENPNIVKKRLKHRNPGISDEQLKLVYHDYLRKELLSYLKDICVQYLGYDALERFNHNGTEIEIPYYYEDFDFRATPRIITSSCSNPNERYFNYLIMDWIVNILPRYYYNDKSGVYEKSDFNMFYQSEKEKRLGQEIQSIKKLVPLKERYRYFR